MRKEYFQPLLPTTDELLPGEFYGNVMFKILNKPAKLCIIELHAIFSSIYICTVDTPDSTPKTALGPMVGFAAFAYATALIVFIVLFVITAKDYITEVSIKSHDATGTDGYTCEMISKVSNTYTTYSQTDPTTSFQLVNVIESKTQCTSDLASADPCNTPQTYIPGTSSGIDLSFNYYKAVGLYGSDLAYVLDGEGILTVYNYAQGNQSYGTWASRFDLYTTSIGIGPTGIAYMLSATSQYCVNVSCVVATTPLVSFSVVAAYDTRFGGIFNDNLNNVFLYDNFTVYAVDYVANSQSVLLELDPAEGLVFNAVAVYTNPATSLATVYYSAYNGSEHWTMYMHEAGVTTTLRVTRSDLSVIAPPLVMDGAQWLYFPCLFNEGSSAVCALDLTDLSLMYFLWESLLPSNTITYPSIAMASDASRIFVLGSSPADAHTVSQSMYYPDTDVYEDVAYQAHFSAAWYTCGKQLIYPVPVLASVYNSMCSSNGVVGEVLYQEEYRFTVTDAAAFALSHSASLCPALYEQVCAVVADLPPYSCSKKVYPSLFSVLGTAFANTMFLVSSMLFLFGLALTRLAKYYPPVGTNVHRPESDLNKELELSSVADTENPMTTE